MGPHMMRRPPKYVHGFIDRHGRPRFYFRRAGFKRVPLPDLPWSPEFMEKYQTALDQTPRVEIGAGRTVAGTVNAVVISYFASAAFQNLAPASRQHYCGIIERFRREHGDKRIATLRLVLELLLHTAQRRADVIRLGLQHIRGGVLSVRQQKTGKSLAIPVSPALAVVLDATPSQHLTFLVTDDGKPFEAAAFTKWFRRCCDAVGLSGYSAHGLRKAACRRLAEAGCSVNEIAAISGHASLREVERYTRAADQARMARNAMARTRKATSGGKPC